MAVGRELLYPGQKSNIYGVTKSARCHARDFIEDLSPVEQKKVNRLLLRAANSGPIWNEQKSKYIKDDILEFKSKQIRLFYFYDRSDIILTHGWIKKANRPREYNEQIKKACQLRQDYHLGGG
ncbi:MAG TPA: type II toxin-antitoxin system RelE/ParE family toxin [Candidatus Avalokitesvara rifleensis]|uniref:type II toxin-antitoxin system RelE/ParE family toxin n=1 Tax=Candidatus Avalokitesvara rifleensis TaxID=3367620 RepID=UPI0027126EB5|nr:type II toxin-antitoxin system RelE/ParE family toxin [Candidatus Brocadiales bacterium]